MDAAASRIQLNSIVRRRERQVTLDASAINSALSRFSKLCHLRIKLPAGSDVSACNRVITTIGALSPTTMRTLKLKLPAHSDVISFAPLASLTELQVFVFSVDGVDVQTPPLFTDAQIGQLRNMTSVQQLSVPYGWQPETHFLTRMLQPRHRLKWSELGCITWSSPITATEPLAALLGLLPTLTLLNAVVRCTDVTFLAQLTNLSYLALDFREPQLQPASLIASLRHCTQLKWLKLQHFGLTSAHLEELLPAFPRLSTLSLWTLWGLESLRCFATPALAASLTQVELVRLYRCPASELPQLHALRSLQWINVGPRMSTALTDAVKAAFSIPSLHFPSLRVSKLYVADAAAGARLCALVSARRLLFVCAALPSSVLCV